MQIKKDWQDRGQMKEQDLFNVQVIKAIIPRIYLHLSMLCSIHAVYHHN